MARPRMTLGTRFTLLIACVILFTGVVLVGGFLGMERRYLVQEGRKTHRNATEHLAHLCAESLITRDELGLVNFLKELRRSPDLEEAFCVDSEGQILVHTNLALLGQRLESLRSPWSALPEEAGGDSDQWVYSHTGLQNGQQVVLARAIYSGRAVRTSVRHQLGGMVRRSMGLGSVVLGLALLLAWATARALTGPLRRLVLGTRRVGEGDWDARVLEDGPGEMGELAREFNIMSARLGELDRLKDQFINSVSHDLRNPLSAIATSARMLRTDEIPPASLPLLRVIEAAALRLRTMVNNILDTAKMRDGGGLTYEITTFHPAKLLEELTRLYGPLAEKSKKTLTLQLPSDLPELHADEEKTLRIFLNLLSNAFKFTKEGDRISLSAKVLGDSVEFQVSDSGYGIPQDRLPHLFEPFRSVSADGDGPPRQGTGLGLSIVKALVEGHGGRVRIESDLGKGTTVVVPLPAAKEKR